MPSMMLMENGRFFGKIPECPGTWGEGATLEAARDELESVLESWIICGLQWRHHIPVIDSVDLNPAPDSDYAKAGQAI